MYDKQGRRNVSCIGFFVIFLFDGLEVYDKRGIRDSTTSICSPEFDYNAIVGGLWFFPFFAFLRYNAVNHSFSIVVESASMNFAI